MRVEPVMVEAAVASSAILPGQGQRGAGDGFGWLLGQAIQRLTDLQATADAAAQRVALGDLAHLHEAVVALQEASLALELVVQVRNHLVEGVQELLRTQA